MTQTSDWTHQTPKKVGFYWCRFEKRIRMVKVWKQSTGAELYTNEDGGASLDDNMYLGVLWNGPISPPELSK